MLRDARRLSESYGRQLRGSGSGDQLGELYQFYRVHHNVESTNSITLLPLVVLIVSLWYM